MIKWISVKDAYPAIDHSYEDDVFSIVVLIYNGESWAAGLFDYSEDFWLSLQPNFDTSKVTHWADVNIPLDK